MWLKKWHYHIFLILLVFMPTILVSILKCWFEIDRPVFVYEYLFVFILMTLNFRSGIIWSFYLLVFLLDITTLFSKLYLFNVQDFLNNIMYLKNYSINPKQIFLLFFSLCVLFGLYFLFNLIKSKIKNDKVSLKLYIYILLVIIILDNINGSSIIIGRNPELNFIKGNFAGLPSIQLYRSLKNNNINSNAPSTNSIYNKSISFQELVPDSQTNQMLLIVESFGLIEDSSKRKLFQKSITKLFQKYRWNTKWGQARFSGSTTKAELRELMNSTGDYRYFNDKKNAKSFKSIFQIKKEQGYHVSAIHSFKGNMFERVNWWRNIGADKIYFLEDVQVANNFKMRLNYESPFISLNDEDAFDFIQSTISTNGKQFIYFLTENAHLPFRGNPNKSELISSFDIDKEVELSDEAKYQYKRISNFLLYVAKNLDRERIQKLLIVGDHMPPFIKEADRSFYSNKYVPFCIITPF